MARGSMGGGGGNLWRKIPVGKIVNQGQKQEREVFFQKQTSREGQQCQMLHSVQVK